MEILASYPMNNSWLDASGKGEHLAPTGSTFDEVNQKIGAACGLFDGFNDVSTSTITSGFSGSFFINAWIRPERTPAGIVDTAIASNVASFSNYWWAIIPVSSGKWRCAMYDGTANPFIDSTTSFTVDAYSMVTLGRNVITDKLQIWINGSLEAQTTDLTTVTPVYSDFTIGGQPNVGGRWFKGQVDAVTPYSGVPTAEFITWLWNGGLGREITGGIQTLRRRMEGH